MERDMLDRWAACVGERRAIEEFIEFIEGKGVLLDYHNSSAQARSLDSLLNEYHDIDAKRLDEQRRALLDSARQPAPEQPR